MQPEIDLFGLKLQTFGLMFGIGFLVAGAVVARRMKELGKSPDWAYELTFSALMGGLVGGKIWYVIEHADSGDVFDKLFSGTGLVWYGGALGGAAGVLLWAAWRRMLTPAMADMCAPALAVGYAIGRIGCQLSGDGDYGKASDLPWAMAYPDGTVPTTDEVHPTPVYETLAMGLVALVLWRWRDRVRPGLLIAWYLVAAGAERFLTEFIRRNDDVFVGLTTAQLFSVGMVLAGAAWLVRSRVVAVPGAPPARRVV